MSVKGGAGDARKIKAAERRLLALELRKQGGRAGSYRNIAATLKEKYPGLISPRYSEGAAYKDVMDALNALNRRALEEADSYRRLKLERLDDLFGVFFSKAMAGDEDGLAAVLAIMGKRAALLGLNAPIKVDQTSLNVAVTADDLAAAKAKAQAYEKEQLGDDVHNEAAAAGE